MIFKFLKKADDYFDRYFDRHFEKNNVFAGIFSKVGSFFFVVL